MVNMQWICADLIIVKLEREDTNKQGWTMIFQLMRCRHPDCYPHHSYQTKQSFKKGHKTYNLLTRITKSNAKSHWDSCSQALNKELMVIKLACRLLRLSSARNEIFRCHVLPSRPWQSGFTPKWKGHCHSKTVVSSFQWVDYLWDKLEQIKDLYGRIAIWNFLSCHISGLALLILMLLNLVWRQGGTTMGSKIETVAKSNPSWSIYKLNPVWMFNFLLKLLECH